MKEGYYPKEDKGQINLGSKIRITDPCYDPDTWCAGSVDIKPGTYDCYQYKHGAVFEFNGETQDDTRIGAIEIRHKDCENPVFSEHLEIDVGVDSGQAGFFDQSYFEEVKSDPEKDDEWYSRACDKTYKRDDPEVRSGTIDDKGFLSSSGYGDGGYDCFASRNKDGNIDALLIVYIWPEVDRGEIVPDELQAPMEYAERSGYRFDRDYDDEELDNDERE